MAQNPTTTPTASWGIFVEKIGSLKGIITDITIRSEALFGTEQNEIGAVIQQSLYDKKTTIDATIQVEKGTEPPKMGEKIRIDETDYYVTSASIIENNLAYRKLAVSAECFKHCSETKDVGKVENTAGA